jgi:threonine dehydrogenase-like Zn-dependent dehydrogenase
MMKSRGARLYGKMDIRVEEFDLPDIGPDEILARVYADTLCMSTLKAAKLGPDHKRVPDNVAVNPILTGHEFAGELVAVGDKWKDRYAAGDRFTIQPAINYKGSMDSPGYSYPYCGGDATMVILPPELMEMDCLLVHSVEEHFRAALAEPYSCVIGACRSLFRTDRTSHRHFMGIRSGGKMAILGGCGPMGLAAIDYAMAGPQRPVRLVVTDTDDARIEQARSIYQPTAIERGIELFFINPLREEDGEALVKQLSGGAGFDDILVMVAHPAILEQADRLLAFNGCINFFAGPTDDGFSAKINYFGIHYYEHHVIGTTGGTADDEREALTLMEEGLIRPETIVSHVGGLNVVPETTLALDTLPGGKKLIYTGFDFPLLELSSLGARAEKERWLQPLADIVENSNGLWSLDAEKWIFSTCRPRSGETE